jgi:hypothetical protein
MSDNNLQLDAQIIHAAYAERVKEAFKVFAENLMTGENEKNLKERFSRAMDLTRKARDMALDTLGGVVVVEPTGSRFASQAAAGTPLTPEEQSMIDQAVSGTTGHRTLPPSPSALARR